MSDDADHVEMSQQDLVDSPGPMEQSQSTPASAGEDPNKTADYQPEPTPESAAAPAVGGRSRRRRYQIGEEIGRGGMGVVYRARDTKLGRDVAIKILPELFAADPDRLMRFEREAKTLASLNHPHIAQIYGIEESVGAPALVMELVEGEDLAPRIAHGPLPLDEALAIARQIADALEAAHEQGIIHRDLKPQNIKVRADGTVKVLDFGLAKALDRSGGAGGAGRAGGEELLNSPTITSPAMTAAGLILGTAAYMSPEQAAGRPVDKRSDIWAFGVVLMEMLTGRQTFGGETVSHVIASVLKDSPDWTALPNETPAAIRTLLRRCLEKDRRRRLADFSDARLELDDAVTQPMAPVQVRPARGRAGLWSALGVGGGAVIAAFVIGISDGVISVFFSPNLSKILATLLVALVLIFRPEGLFGGKAR